jgi:hypothetical protein
VAKIQSGQAMDLFTISQMEAKVGDYKWSHLDTTPFNEEHLGAWMLCDGQSSTGTAFEAATGETNVPNALADGTFIRQAKPGRGKGSAETDSTAANGLQSSDSYLSHIVGAYPQSGKYIGTSTLPRNGGSEWIQTGNGSGPALGKYYVNSLADVNISGGSVETAPKNIALNLYVKVDY